MAFWIHISAGARRLNRGLRSSEYALLAIILILNAGDLFFVGGCRKASPTEPPNQVPDTTSHAMSWTTFRFGESLSGFIEDVSIVNDTLAYAVGKIYLKDSTGAIDPLCYNFFHWDGSTWSVERQAVRNEITSVCAFAPNDIWVASGGPLHWDGQYWTVGQIQGVFSPARVYHFWGTNSNDLYMGGDNGQLAHYNGVEWKKVETGTTLPVKDIFGALNTKTSNYEVLAVAGDQYSSLDRMILKLDGVLASPLSDQPLTVPVTTSGLHPVNNTTWLVPAYITRRSWLIHFGKVASST